MASAYSILRNYGDYIQPYDFNLIQQGLEYKQQKYDANSARIQAQIDQFANLELAKDEDRQYLNQRLQTLVDQVNQYGAIDLSSNGITRNISNHIKQTLDENVMTAYAGTQNLKKYQQEVAYYKKNKPDAYSPVNEMYGMRSAIEWLNDGKVGSSYKGSSYIPFTDVQGKLNKVITEMVKNRPESEVELPTNDGYIVKKKVKELNAEEIRTVATNMLSAQDRQQISINGWYNFGRVAPEQSQSILDEYKTERLSVLEGQISALQLKKKGGVNDTLKQEIDNQISFLQRQKNNFEIRLGNVPNDSASIGSFLEQERLVNGLVSTHAFKEVSIAYDNDQSYWNRVNHEYKQLKDLRDYELDLRKQQFEEQKFATEQAQKRAQQNSFDSDGDGLQDFTVTSRTTGENGEDINPEKEIFSSIEQNESMRKSLVGDFYDGLEGTNKSDFDKALSAWRLEDGNKDKTDDELKLEVALNLANNGQNTDFMSVDMFNRLSTIDAQLKGSKQALVTAANEANKGILKKADKLYDVAVNNKGISTFDIKNGKAVKVSLKDYLEGKGINSFEELKANKKEYDKFLRQAYSDMLITEMGFGVNENLGGAPQNNKQIAKNKPKFQYYVNQLATSFGEQVDFDDLFDSEVKYLRGGDISFGSNTNIFNLKNRSASAPKTLKFLKNVFNAGAYDKGYGFFDNSFQDDRTSRNILSYKASRDVYRDKLQEAYGKLPQNKTVGLKSKTQLHKEAASIAETIEGGFKVEDGTDIRVYQNPTSPSEVYIEQVQTAGKSAKSGIVEETRRVSVPKKDLQNSNLTRLINLENQKSNITVSRMRPITKTNVNFADDGNLDYLEGVKTFVFGNNNPQAELLTKQGARKNLFTEYGAFYTDDNGNESDVSKVVDEFIADTSPFKITARPNATKTSILIDVDYKDANGQFQDLDAYDLQTANFDEYQSIYDVAPQIFLFTTLKKILDESISESVVTGGQLKNDRLQKLKNLYNIR